MKAGDFVSKFYDIEEYEDYFRSRDLRGDRVILHSDLNNFFASVESLESGCLDDIPLAVCGDVEMRHGIVLAKNELAKRYGIRTGETVSSALKKCPFLIMKSVHYGKYVTESRRVREIYLSYATRVEPFGIDEAWLDVTELAKRRNKTDIFNAGFSIADEIRGRIKKETGLTVSIGVSFNKSFSKLASDLKKPDAVSVISPDNFKNIVWGMPVCNLLYVGRRMREELIRMKILTVGDLAAQKRAELKSLFGKMGELLWDRANGFDFSSVEDYGEGDDTKSISCSTTTPYDVLNVEEADSVLISLVNEVSRQLRERNIYSSVVKVFVKYSDFSTIVRQEKLAYPTSSSENIFSISSRLFKFNVDFSLPVRSIGVGVEGFSETVGEQISAFSIVKETPLDRILDKTRKKYGEKIIRKASVIKNERLSSFDGKRVAFNSGI